MKILYNLRSLAMPRTGIGHYTQHLIEGMLQHPEINDVVGINKKAVLTRAGLMHLNQQDASAPPSLLTRIKKRLNSILRSLPVSYRLRFYYFAYLSAPARKRFAKAGFIYHETNFIPEPYQGKLVISVHDLSHVRYPEFHPPARVRYLNTYLPQALARADKVIAGSEFSRQEILACYHVNPDKIITVLDGVDAQFMPREQQLVMPVLDRYKLKYRHYILSVCTLEPRKNLVRLLAAYSSLSVEARNAYPIVLVGVKGWQNQDIFRLAEPLVDAGQLVFTGYVSQQQLCALYSGAKMFAYPSLYEGFGLPVLEAMASGIPVVTSNVSSLPEVSGGAALEVDPLSVPDITNAMLRLLEDTKLAEQCILKGLERAKLLTWQQCVEATVKVYRSLTYK